MQYFCYYVHSVINTLVYKFSTLIYLLRINSKKWNVWVKGLCTFKLSIHGAKLPLRMLTSINSAWDCQFLHIMSNTGLCVFRIPHLIGETWSCHCNIIVENVTLESAFWGVNSDSAIYCMSLGKSFNFSSLSFVLGKVGIMIVLISWGSKSK